MKVGVIGAGTMGAGIAQAFAMTDGYDVCLCDIKQEFAEDLKELKFPGRKGEDHPGEGGCRCGQDRNRFKGHLYRL